METILVVDDNREIVDSLGKLLAIEGYEILTACDGIEALDKMETEKVDLILLDVMMPRLNGLSALMKIREKHNIPAIILSAKTEESDKVSGLSLGADAYIEKRTIRRNFWRGSRRSFEDTRPMAEAGQPRRKGQKSPMAGLCLTTSRNSFSWMERRCG